MFRSTAVRMCAAKELHNQKMSTLYKIIVGDISFKNKAPVKDSTVTEVFGSSWSTDLKAWFASDFTAKMDKADKEAATVVLEKYLTRLDLTRYTTRELGQFMTTGAANVAATAEAHNVSQAKEFIKANSEAAFKAHVIAEAANSNWTSAQAEEFMKKVKSA
eukprot:TRINITY_DN3186_c0_g2_i1.p1 TRINITY_DN3186_c0_g2~~TRINITY_DN3186_c0_g2_i1.p1  ORF type:complete len:161 (+),score=51.37 TRINITY_DN3186_c0_g2_i1:73-555(+)